MSKIKVLLVDDHEIVYMGVEKLLSSSENIKLVGIAKDGEDALLKVKKLAPDIVLLDINLPKMNGIKVTEEIIKKNPATKIILHTSYVDEEYIVKGFEVGAMGYVPKNFNPDQLVEAIEMVYNGKRYIKGLVSEVLMNSFFKKEEKKDMVQSTNLTERELEVLKYIIKGLTNNDIAQELYISVRTVEVHKANIMKKLSINNTAELVVYAIKNGLVQL
ncbi:MAG: response regulator transcription factor [Bacteroidales bacterium]|nr:response regulator transcription factor [Bacteroidales bacterium]